MAFTILALLISSYIPANSPAALHSQPDQTTVIQASEASLRKIAKKSVMPRFPEASMKKGANGVAIAKIEFDGKGDAVKVEVLESPDENIKAAVADAARQWKIAPSTMKGKPVHVLGKLTFYYVIDSKGSGRVENPRHFR